MRRIISIINEADKKRSLWYYHTVLCEYDNGEQTKVCMYPEEYEYELLKQNILDKYPELERDIETVLELHFEHSRNENYRDNAE